MALAAGAGVEEEVAAGSDAVYDRASGVGSGAGSAADGGQRAGSSYVFSQAAVREFRVLGQGDATAYGSALYGHGVGGVVTTVSRSGGTRLHGMAFYTVRDSAWAAANPFSIASSYADGVVTSAVVKPQDQRQQFGGSIGGPVPGFSPAPTRQSVAQQRGPGAAAVLFLCVRCAASKFSCNLRTRLRRLLFVDGVTDGVAGESWSDPGPDQCGTELPQ